MDFRGPLMPARTLELVEVFEEEVVDVELKLELGGRIAVTVLAAPEDVGRPVRVDLTIAPGEPHLLTIDSFVHPQLRPGRARLLDCAS